MRETAIWLMTLSSAALVGLALDTLSFRLTKVLDAISERMCKNQLAC
jgi:hypothetical protein